MVNFFKASTKKQTLGQKLTVAIERLDLNGCGVARHQNKPIFIAGALPGEQVEVQVYEQKSKYFRGRLLSVNSENQHRVLPFCQHYKQCGGCDLQHLDYSEQIVFKKNKLLDLFARNNIDIALPWQPAILASEQHYRRKARIGVQYAKDGTPIIGFRQKSTNQLTSIKRCPVFVESIAAIFSPLKKLIATLSVTRAIGHVEVIATQDVTLIIRQLKPLNDADKQTWLKAAKDHSWQLIFDLGETLLPLTDISALTYPLPGGINITFSGQDFIQVNHDVNTLMVEQAIDWLNLSSTDKVLDLFCGLGNFSLPVAAQVERLVGVEGVQAMVDRASENALNNDISNCSFYQQDLNADWINQSWAKQGFDKVILDPARAGALEAIEQLVTLKIDKILYVSCDPATLARDAKALLIQGYKIEKIALMDMFSQTKHIETMVLFSYQ